MLRRDIALNLRRLEMGIDSNQLLIDPHFGEHDEDWQLQLHSKNRTTSRISLAAVSSTREPLIA
jgi:hypothetical protein